MEDLDALRELTERIKEFPPVTKIEVGEEEQPICHYRLTSGETKAFNIFLGEEKICVDHWEARAGSKFPWHIHNEKEWVNVPSPQAVGASRPEPGFAFPRP